MPTQFFIKTPGGEKLIGTSRLRTVVTAAALVAERPQRRGEYTRAIALGTALSAAQDAGANHDELEQAFQLGETIGRTLHGKNRVKGIDRPQLITRFIPD